MLLLTSRTGHHFCRIDKSPRLRTARVAVYAGEMKRKWKKESKTEQTVRALRKELRLLRRALGRLQKTKAQKR